MNDEEIIKEFGNELASKLTPSNDTMEAVRLARKLLGSVLKQVREESMTQNIRIVEEVVAEFNRTEFPEFWAEDTYAAVSKWLRKTLRTRYQQHAEALKEAVEETEPQRVNGTR